MDAHGTIGDTTGGASTSSHAYPPREKVDSIPSSLSREGIEGLGGATVSSPHEEVKELAVEADLEAATRKKDEDIPDGGYGWVIVGCTIAQNAVTWGVNTTYGVYSAYYLANNHFEGGSTFKYAWVGGACVAVALIIAPGVNWMTRTFGFRVPLMIGSALVVLGQCLAGICTTYAGFLACQGIVFGLGLGMTMVPVQPLMSHWFDKRLALAQGIGAAGSGLGGLCLALITRTTLENLGVKWSLIINGLISLVVLVPVVILLKSRHAAIGAKSASFQVKWLVHPGFIWILLWGVFSLMMYFIALYSLASFATHGLGLSQTQGAALQSILAAAQMLGRPLWGYFLDLGGRNNMVLLCYVLSGLSCLAIWLPAQSFGVLIFFAIVQGFTGGTIWSAAAPLTRQVAGVQDLSSALSVFWVVIVPSSLVGQPIAVALLDYSTNHLGRTGVEAYYISIGLCGGMGVLSGLCLLGSKRYLQGNWSIFTIS